MKVRSWCLTDKGLRREANQDSFLINESLGLYIVADGMGGHSGGEVASNLAVETAEEVLIQNQKKDLSARELIMMAFEEANRRILYMATFEKKELSGMGTTMVLAIVMDERVYIGNVGDSRAYLYKDPNLWQITEDHSLINEQIRAGLKSEEEIRAQVARNVITRSVGFEKEVHPDVIERKIYPGEIFILCSDGLSSMVSDSEISETLGLNPPEKMVKACIDHALKNGGDDNVTVLALQFYD